MNLLQKHALKIAIYFKEICEKNNLEYRLGGGTLLGAIRHKGFIPWDDDIDFEMPREDYNKFIKIIERENKQTYSLRSWDEKDYPWCFAKLDDKKTTLILNVSKMYGIKGGVFIDIFPIDGTFENLFLRKIHLMFLRRCILLRQIAFGMEHVPKSRASAFFIGYLLKIKKIRSFFRGKFFKSIIYFILTLKGFRNSKYVGFLGWGWDNCIIKKTSFDNWKYISFENIFFKISDNHSEYLSRIYGEDYMEIPPKEKQVGHGTLFFDISLPYDEYQNDDE